MNVQIPAYFCFKSENIFSQGVSIACMHLESYNLGVREFLGANNFLGGWAVAVRLSVCRPSVTRWHCIKITQATIVWSSL